MTTKLACSYAILKFLPYGETGEFVNIGVALVCPAIRFFGVRTTHRVQRVNNFFKELDPNIYRTGLAHFKDTVHDIEKIVGDAVEREQMIFPVEHARVLDLFRNFTCPREAMFRFGATGQLWQLIRNRSWRSFTAITSKDSLQKISSIRSS